MELRTMVMFQFRIVNSPHASGQGVANVFRYIVPFLFY